MAFEIVVPRLGWSMDEGTFTEWLKQEGEWVNAGDMLFVLEGDKAAEEIESFDAGVLRIPPDAPKPGEDVVVGQLLAYLVAEGEPAPFEMQANRHMRHATPAAAVAGEIAARQPTRVESAARSGRRSTVAISPRARRVARELGVDWAQVSGTGRNGRIRERDIRSHNSGRLATDRDPSRPEAEVSGRSVGISRIRRTIAERMLAGVQQAAPVTLTTKADATNLVSLKRQYQQEAAVSDTPPPGYTDLIVKLVAAALQQHPRLKSQWCDDKIFIPDATHIAFAVDTDAGLLAPVIRDVPGRTVQQVATESRRLTTLALGRQLHADLLRGATFTVSNMGGLGIDAFTPILHLPQSAILGVGRVVREPVVMHDDAIVPREMMALSLTFDHRVLDGAPAARFLDAVRQLMADPFDALGG